VFDAFIRNILLVLETHLINKLANMGLFGISLKHDEKISHGECLS
jgi:hypothetical protein